MIIPAISIAFIFQCFFGASLGFRFKFISSNVKHRDLYAMTDSSPIALTSEINAIKLHAIEALNKKASENKSLERFIGIIASFIDEYTASSIEANETPDKFKYNLLTLLKLVQEALQNPYQFQPFHTAIREPLDYYKWGNDFLRPLIKIDDSKMLGIENTLKIKEFIKQGDNVIILSNHQTECDPQVLSILCEKEGVDNFAENVIFIAGHKVTNDPIAIPFSMGRNLICIHSKKHIKTPPEDYPIKQAQNLRSMKCLGDLASEGGKIFWVAPSGGRDRPGPDGENFVVAPFDMKALDMFKLIAMQSGKKMHFFPMAMYTNKLVPPPAETSSTLGESRSAKRGPVSVHLLDETDGLGGLKDKEFTKDIQDKVEVAYSELVAFHNSQSS